MTRVAILLLLLAAAPALAQMRIVDLAGEPAAMVVMRDGKPVALEPFMGLRPHDEVRVLQPGAYVVIAGGGTTIRVAVDSSPYRVEAIERPSVIDNLMTAAIEVYRTVTGHANDPTEVFARGDPKMAPSLRCLGHAENLVPAGLPIHVFWSDGQAPFALTLSNMAVSVGDRAPRVSEDAHAGERAFEPLPTGAYRIALMDGAGQRARYPGHFMVVPQSRLPEPVPQIIGSALPTPARQRLAAALLQAHDAWRYSATLYAAESGDEALLAAILAKGCD